MVKQSPHKQWTGHCSMCAWWNGKQKNAGDTARTPYRVLRKLGVKRRYSRNKAYGED